MRGEPNALSWWACKSCGDCLQYGDIGRNADGQIGCRECGAEGDCLAPVAEVIAELVHERDLKVAA